MKHGRRRHLESMKVLSSRLHAGRTMNPCKPPLVPGISLQTLRVEAATSKTFQLLRAKGLMNRLNMFDIVRFVPFPVVFVPFFGISNGDCAVLECSKANLAAVVPGLHLTGDVEQCRGTFELHLLHTQTLDRKSIKKPGRNSRQKPGRMYLKFLKFNVFDLSKCI